MYRNYIVALLGLNAALTPWYIKSVGPATMGSWLACSQLISISLMLDGGISAIVLRESVSVEDSSLRAQATQRLLVAGMIISIFAAIAVIFLAMIIGSLALGLTNPPPGARDGLAKGIVFASVSTGIGLPYYMAHTAGQVWGSVRAIAVTSLVATTIGFLVSAALVPTFGIQALGLGALVTATLRTVFGVGWAYVQFQSRGLKVCRPVRQDFDRLLRPATKSMGMRIVDWSLNNIETTLAAIFISPAVATAVSLNGRVFSLCQVVSANFANSRFTRLASSLGGERSEQKAVSRKYFTFGFLIASGPMLLGLFLNREILDFWVGSQFYLGANIGVLLFLARLSLACNNLFSNYCLAAGLYSTALRAALVEAATRLLAQVAFAATSTTNWMLAAPAISVLGVTISVYVPAIAEFLQTSFRFKNDVRVIRLLLGVGGSLVCFSFTAASGIPSLAALGVNLIMLALMCYFCRAAIRAGI